MSQISGEMGRKAFILYRRIYKLHVLKLPSYLRRLGVEYAREEFRTHLRKATSQQFWVFIKA